MEKKQTIYIGNASSKGIIYLQFQNDKIEISHYTDGFFYIFEKMNEKYVLVANQDSNEISVFSRDYNTGKISFLESKSIASPTCILIGEEE